LIEERKLTPKELEKYVWCIAHLRRPHTLHVPPKVLDILRLKHKDECELIIWNIRTGRYEGCKGKVYIYEYVTHHLSFRAAVLKAHGILPGNEVFLLDLIRPVRKRISKTYTISLTSWEWNMLRLAHRKMIKVKIWWKGRELEFVGRAHKTSALARAVEIPITVGRLINKACRRVRVGIRKIEGE